MSGISLLIALVDPPIGYSWDNLYDGSIWFKLLSQFLYMQLMAHFEIKLAAPTVEFKVPLLNLIADKDTGAEPEKAIVQMNALVLGAYIYFQGLAQFQKLTEEDENRLSADMEDVGAHHPVSVQEDTYTYYRGHSRRISTQVKICCKILNKSCIFSKWICQKLTDKEQLALKLEEVYQQNEEDKKGFHKARSRDSLILNIQQVSLAPGVAWEQLLKMGMGSWAVQVEAFVQSNSVLGVKATQNLIK
ncbi:hypothetical protein C8J57DRAFT_1220924 [Mycena rebaudengoi]|nr:hypothetical protein C8J57DRAFT_1220924 [Mycena rebaudengoi]